VSENSLGTRPAEAPAAASRTISLGAWLTPATPIFLISRLAVWAVALLVFAWFPLTAYHGSGMVMPHEAVADYGPGLWSRWDSGYFLEIAHKGYGNDGTAAFYPVYPALVGILGRVLGHHYTLAGLIVSLAACLVAFELLWRVARDRLGTSVGAERAVVLLAVTPMAVFLGAVYSESTYLAVCLAAFLCAARGRWTLAACAASLALLTRPTGIALVAAVAILAWPNRRALAWLAIVPLSFVFFPIALAINYGRPFAFVTVERFWHRHLSIGGPFGGLWDGISVFWRFPENHQILAINVENLVFTLVYLGLLVLVWRWCTLAESVFAALSILIPLSAPVSGDLPLLSMPRFGLVVFPFFVVLARLASTPRRYAALAGISALLLGVEIVKWVTYQWVS
jgi:hypothetical protein